MANGGLNRIDKKNLGHTGVHMYKYNSTVSKKCSPQPKKEATTFYYQSDGTGRDSYVLKNNGGLRIEHDNKSYGDRVFKDSLRSSTKSKLKHFTNMHGSDRSDITNYLNWSSKQGQISTKKNYEMQKDLMKRLTTGSPNRIHTIKYIIGNGKIGEEKRSSVTSFQGYKSSYTDIKKLSLPLND